MEYTTTLSQTQWTLVLASLVVAGFGLLAGFLYSVITRSEVTARYRTASDAGAMLQLVAFLAYVVLVLAWVFGYDKRGDQYVPAGGFRFDIGFRYTDWAVTVPLLMIELTAALVVVGAARSRLRAVVIPASLLMIVTGFIGTDPASDHDAKHTPLLVWGAISTVFFVITFAALAPAILKSMKELPAPAAVSLRNLSFLLVATWGVYPIVYMFPVFFGMQSANGVTIREVLLSVTDVVAKAGYTALIHKIGKIRSAQDVNDGLDTHPEGIFVSGEKLAEARPAVAVALAAELAGTTGRTPAPLR